TEEGLYRLAGKGKLALAEYSELSEQDVTIPTQIPRKFKHFAAINDVRFRFEEIGRSGRGSVLFFFSERELALYYQRSGSASPDILFLLDHHGIKPDALCKLRVLQGEPHREMYLAIEYDAGTEQSAFFGRTKVKHYGALVRASQGRIGELKVLTFTDTIKRLVSLMRQTVRYRPPRHCFYFAPIDGLRQEQWEETDLFLDPDDFFIALNTAAGVEVCERELSGKPARYSLLTLPATSPRTLSPGEDTDE
ncbi:MAG: replication-relaxation family protein, partial [Blastocatellia bacterium]